VFDPQLDGGAEGGSSRTIARVKIKERSYLSLLKGCWYIYCPSDHVPSYYTTVSTSIPSRYSKPVITRGIRVYSAGKKRLQKKYKKMDRKKLYSQLNVMRFRRPAESFRSGLTLLTNPGSRGMMITNVATAARQFVP
jgi:hypothetical protein